MLTKPREVMSQGCHEKLALLFNINIDAGNIIAAPGERAKAHSWDCQIWPGNMDYF